MTPNELDNGEDQTAAGGPSSSPPPGLSSAEVNFLIYRYLLESGFGHAAFAFASESEVDKLDVRGRDVPVGALVSFVQKGFQLVELEANLNANGSDVYGKYVQFSANDILTKDLDELRRVAEEVQEGAAGVSSPGKKKGKKGAKKGGKHAQASVLEGSNVAVTEGALPALELDAGLENGNGEVGVAEEAQQQQQKQQQQQQQQQKREEDEMVVDGVKAEAEGALDADADGRVAGVAKAEAGMPSTSPAGPDGADMDVDDGLWEVKANGVEVPQEDDPYGLEPPPPPPLDD